MRQLSRKGNDHMSGHKPKLVKLDNRGQQGASKVQVVGTSALQARNNAMVDRRGYYWDRSNES